MYRSANWQRASIAAGIRSIYPQLKELPALAAKAFIEVLHASFAEKGAKARRYRGPEQIYPHLPHPWRWLI
jgi:hypothetical protein